MNGIQILRKYGLGGYLRRRAWRARQVNAEARLKRWLSNHGRALDGNEIDELRRRVEEFPRRPLISVLIPVYDVDERWLRSAIDSVIGQAYDRWELCIADDASPSSHVRRVLEDYASRDERIKVVFRETNGHISAASNSALEIVTGEWTGLLDHDDELTPDSLYRVVEAINANPSAEMLYSDEDVIDESGARHSPKLKPDWSRDLFYSVNYVTHFAVYRAERLREVGGFREGFEGSQDYDLALRVLEKIGDAAIHHIPHILYHWRAIRGSVALAGAEKPYAHERARVAIREHFDRTGVEAEVGAAEFDLHHVRYKLPSGTTATFVCSGRADKRTSDGAVADVVCVGSNPSAEELNRAARDTKGSVLIFLDSDLLPPSPDKIDELVAAASQPGIGVAGGRIVGADGIIEQAGIVLDADLSACFAHRGFPREAGGNLFRATHNGNFLAVSVSCMAVSRAVFDELGGFDRESSLFDVDLCLRVRRSGRRVMTVPSVEFIRLGRRDQRPAQLSSSWMEYAGRDPFCNSDLKRDGSFEIDG